MELKIELAVPAEYFFTELIQSAIYDIQCSVGRNISATRLKNFAYRKVLPNGQHAHYVITDCTPNRCYAYRLRVGRVERCVSYQLEALGAAQMRLAYGEEVNAGSRWLADNIPIGGWLRRHNLTKMVREIEAAYCDCGTPRVQRSSSV
ncbi:DUF3284 domain-containing protein [Lacticaseibacillus zhaodongensis]|uniref:DUF3284 domain-containing protein n=1 Tax=Lacticaseibacillus zhaodongensis TaxID=2668065 RepID=UPI0012D33435|nr:DUF3284 domain-containing protein [Lacticaseibacillus zhaodongensis]